MMIEERIEHYESLIAMLRDNIEWMRGSGFTIGNASVEDLVARDEENIALYQQIIDKLQAGA